jgi:hypothetical protein
MRWNEPRVMLHRMLRHPVFLTVMCAFSVFIVTLAGIAVAIVCAHHAVTRSGSDSLTVRAGEGAETSIRFDELMGAATLNSAVCADTLWREATLNGPPSPAAQQTDPRAHRLHRMRTERQVTPPSSFSNSEMSTATTV